MLKNTYKSYPNEKGYFGQFGGRYVSETLMPLILEVEKEYEKIKNDKNFINEFNHYLKTYVGRPSPLFFAERITNDLGGPKIYFKRDELNHTGAHKTNNVIGQILLAKKMGKNKNIVTILCDYGTKYESKIFNKKFLSENKLPIPSWL